MKTFREQLKMQNAEKESGENKEKLKKKKQVSSYEIFLKYILYDEVSYEPDVSGIFSHECFDEWLSTRPTPANKVKHPAQSYQRVLSAHIRGVDKRRPFKSAIEAKLLRVLRNTQENPWAELFKNEKKEIGKRGFTSKGFHEASSDQFMLNCDTQKADEILPVDFFGGQSEELVSRKRSFPNMYFQSTLRESPQNSKVPWDVLTTVLNNYIPLEHRKITTAAAQERGLVLWSPALYFYMNQMVDSSDFRFSWSFLFPSRDEQFFRTELPVATIFSAFDNTVTHEDAKTVELFRGSILDMHLYELPASVVSLFYSFIGNAPSLYGSAGSVWRREVMMRRDGTRMVVLVHSIKLEKGKILYLQDQSHLFPDVLKNVCFI